jgi:hypothetical protein
MISHPTALDTRLPSSSIMPSVCRRTAVGAWGRWGMFISVMTVPGYLYADSMQVSMQAWLEDDNFSHRPLVPLIFPYLFLFRRPASQSSC